MRRIVSNLTGRLADAREIVQPRYWRRHLREAVRFADGVQTLAGLKPDVCLEIGPNPTLLAFDENLWAGNLAYDKQSAEDAVRLFDLVRKQIATILRAQPAILIPKET